VVAEEERKTRESGTGVAETAGRWHLALEPLGVKFLISTGRESCVYLGSMSRDVHSCTHRLRSTPPSPLIWAQIFELLLIQDK
jgi:hypothetical protein